MNPGRTGADRRSLRIEAETCQQSTKERKVEAMIKGKKEEIERYLQEEAGDEMQGG